MIKQRDDGEYLFRTSANTSPPTALTVVIPSTPNRPSQISIGDCSASGTRAMRRSRVAPPANAIAKPTMTIPSRSNSSRIVSDDPTSARILSVPQSQRNASKAFWMRCPNLI